MRLVPNTDTVPASVNRYLLPHERQVITVHQHPAILIKPIFWVLIGLALAGWLSNSIAHGNGIVILVIWILWGIVFLNLAVKVFEWSVTYFVVTSQRFVLATGIISRKVNMMPLAKVTDMTFQRSPMGRRPRLRRVHPGVRRARPGADQRRLPALPGAALPRGVRADLQGQGREPRLGVPSIR